MKVWYKSKTVWFNFLSAAIPVLESYLALFTPLLGDDATRMYIAIIILGNIMLRFTTTTKLGDHDE